MSDVDDLEDGESANDGGEGDRPDAFDDVVTPSSLWLSPQTASSGGESEIWNSSGRRESVFQNSDGDDDDDWDSDDEFMKMMRMVNKMIRILMMMMMSPGKRAS